MSYVCVFCAMHVSVNDKIKRSVRSSKKAVFLRSDFERFGNYRQVSRALSALENDGLIKRAGYGLYIKPEKQEDIPEVINQIKHRLSTRKRVKRLVTVGEVTVQIGLKSRRRNAQTSLDEKKLQRAKALVRHIDLATLRREGLENLDRWNANGAWCTAHDEWRELLQNADDRSLVSIITGTDQTSNRLRQSSPFPGLLKQHNAEAQ